MPVNKQGSQTNPEMEFEATGNAFQKLTKSLCQTKENEPNETLDVQQWSWSTREKKLIPYKVTGEPFVEAETAYGQFFLLPKD